MTIAASVQNYLSREGVPYETLLHAHTWDSTHTAQAAHVPGDRLAKGVVLEDDKGYLMAVIPATHKVDLGAVRHELKRELGLATDSELADLFKDCERGALPPLGKAYGMEVILDQSLIGAPDIYFEAGDHVALIHVSGKDFLTLMSGAPQGAISHRVK
jgi:Ala-tRNA(Pro) deacylase